ncbi:MAG: TonB family protein [Flavobacteriales bacterium]|nr:TonB family protein [Flavobacteriales bacterium]
MSTMRLLRSLPLLMCLALAPLLHAQDDLIPEPDKKGDGEVFTMVEVMPEYPGGQEALYRYLGSNIKYPEEALDAGISGTVYVTFVVNKEGEITDAKVLRGIGGGCDEEALRVVRAMPRWKPGIQRGKPVLVQYNLPIKYTLTGGGVPREDRLFSEVDVLARFPGGEAALQQYLKDNATHDKAARKVSGVVKVRFEVDRDGNVRNPVVVGSLHPKLDTEALLVVSAMPQWQPALVKTRTVRSLVEVDVPFPKYTKK